MISFLACVVTLIAGMLLYSRFAERVFGMDKNRPMPCQTKYDGVDYLPLPTWKIFLIQFLNIAGTGPIFGAVMGMMFGPAAYLWIVFGCIFGGAVHDYLSAMISLRMGGACLPDQITALLGKGCGMALRLVTFVLLFMVVSVFVSTPANLLSQLTSGWGVFGSVWFWGIVVYLYYILATILPVHAIIGRIYPVFGLAVIVMAVGIGVGVFTHDGWMPELTDAFTSHHPKGLKIIPMVCVSVACGAVSGFHATQSPMMVRCLKNEKLARPVFYGAMITEGVIAMIWAAAAIKYTGGYEELASQVKGNPADLVNRMCVDWMGKIGGILAILGVVFAPISTGDTAMRSARIIAADFFHIDQKSLFKRVLVVIPIVLVTMVLLAVKFDVLWRYFAWLNQVLSVFTLWAISEWLRREKRFYWISLVPALFMTVICTSYILVCPRTQGGLGCPEWLSFGVSALICLAISAWFFGRRSSSGPIYSVESHQ